ARRGTGAPRGRPTRGRRPAGGRHPSVVHRARRALAAHLGRQADDVWGVGLIALGLLAGLGIYADLTGPLGHLLRDGAGSVLGWGRLLVPVALVGVGGSLVQGRLRNEPARPAIAFSFLTVAACGLLHLARG